MLRTPWGCHGAPQLSQIPTRTEGSSSALPWPVSSSYVWNRSRWRDAPSQHHPVPLFRLDETGGNWAKRQPRTHGQSELKFEILVNFPFRRNQPQLSATPHVLLFSPSMCSCCLLKSFPANLCGGGSSPRLKLQGPFIILQKSLGSLTPRSCGQKANIAWTLSAGAQGSSASPDFHSGWDTGSHFSTCSRSDRSRVIQDLQEEAVAVPNIHIQLET